MLVGSIKPKKPIAVRIDDPQINALRLVILLAHSGITNAAGIENSCKKPAMILAALLDIPWFLAIVGNQVTVM